MIDTIDEHVASSLTQYIVLNRAAIFVTQEGTCHPLSARSRLAAHINLRAGAACPIDSPRCEAAWRGGSG